MSEYKIDITYNEKLNKELDYSPLKLHFWVIDNTVVMKVLEQDSRLCIDDFWFNVEVADEDNAVEIKFLSCIYPELDSYHIYFRGIDSENNNVTTSIVLTDNEQAQKYVEVIQEVFENIDFMKSEIFVDIIDTTDIQDKEPYYIGDRGEIDYEHKNN